ncbi:hypothetical protein DAPPUDRAFT_249413 [Daphnia pulex]|uniref:Uncharacterized protein n=1 Tax=Daphnia pulex TaxID=6669 RepID=E9GWL8_DAPPU|nr:hypothetical protein DAPPUDRAFT_249413 [Daphnia pulex]|eukprot:EFX76162.1 hypothetical protein DAPPUDRAFT_249413 [Daphnia pulex]
MPMKFIHATMVHTSIVSGCGKAIQPEWVNIQSKTSPFNRRSLRKLLFLKFNNPVFND